MCSKILPNIPPGSSVVRLTSSFFWGEMSCELVTVCCRKEYVHSCENICDDQLLDSVREQTRGEQ